MFLKKAIKPIYSCLVLNLIVACTQNIRVPKQDFDVSVYLDSNLQLQVADTHFNEPQLDGIPLSCRIAYAQSISIDSANEDSYTEQWNRRYQESTQIVNTYLNLGLGEQALRFAKSEPSSTRPWFIIAQYFAQNGQIEKAIQIAKTFVPEQNPESQQEAFIKLYLIAGQLDSALKVVELVDSRSSSFLLQSKYLVEIAAIYAQQGQIAKAQQLTDRSWKIITSSTKSHRYEKAQSDVLSVAASKFSEAGQNKQALDFLRRMEKKDSRTSELLTKIARSYIHSNQLNQALELLSEAQELNESLFKQQLQIDHQTLPSHSLFDASLIVDSASAYAEAGEYDQALEVLNTYENIFLAYRKSSDIHENKFNLWRLKTYLKIAEQASESKQLEKQQTFLDLASGIVKSLEDGSQKINFLVDVAKLNWKFSRKPKANEILVQAHEIAGKINKKDALSGWLSIAAAYLEMDQIDQAKQMLNEAWFIMKEIPISQRSEIYFKNILFAVLINYSRLEEYSKALSVAQIEANLEERNRLTDLIRCAMHR